MFQMTICLGCGRLVHTTPGFCQLCGEVFHPTVMARQVAPSEREVDVLEELMAA